jgi:hypothetical protein
MIYGGPEWMSEEEHAHSEAIYEELVEARDKKGLYGLKILAALREHQTSDSFGVRARGQIGQG